MKVYLAGPIQGQTYDSAANWRKFCTTSLKDNGINGYSPMRGKVYLSKIDKLDDSYSNFTMSSINGINVRDFNDVRTSDAILVNFLGCGDKVSIGTVMEIAWARAFHIPIIIVMEQENVHNHGMLTFGNIVVDNIEDGLAAIYQILLP
jgi:nucleoside 2-deoxyribosyltransferase